jgi:uncharacterized protein (TIGR02145 family)
MMRKLISIIFLSTFCSVFSQTIENVDFRAVGKTISVSYDFLHPKADTSINVALVFKDQQGLSIVPKSISGDINNVKPGQGKRINWDVLADEVSLSGQYKTEIEIIPFNAIKIGNQFWAIENLNVDRFRNGDPIPQAKTNDEWKRAGQNKQPAWCYYNNDHKNGSSYGKLYNWYAVVDLRGLAPSGLKIPTENDWNLLIENLGGRYEFGNKFKSTAGWSKNIGNNTSGLCALPGGYRHEDGQFFGVVKSGYWWSSSYHDHGSAACVYADAGSAGIFYLWSGDGMAVRCIKSE